MLLTGMRRVPAKTDESVRLVFRILGLPGLSSELRQKLNTCIDFQTIILAALSLVNATRREA